MDPVIELDGLEVRFGDRTILKKLKAKLTGRSIGLLGPNGAGKSTLINTLLGFHKPSSGTARIFGKRRAHASARSAQPDRLHAGERRLHLFDERRALRPPDGRTLRPAAPSTPWNARTKRSSTSVSAKFATARWAPTRWA